MLYTCLMYSWPKLCQIQKNIVKVVLCVNFYYDRYEPSITTKFDRLL